MSYLTEKKLRIPSYEEAKAKKLLTPEPGEIVEIDIPKYDFDWDSMKEDDIVGQIRLPYHQYFVYLDKYRFNRPHLAHAGDMIYNIVMFWEDDFEGFDYTTDVLFSSDNAQEVLKWYVEDYIKIEYPTSKTDKDEWIERAEKLCARNQSAHRQILDNLDVLYDFCVGDDKIDEYEWNGQDALIAI